MTFYGVWEGKKKGIYTDWATCSEQIKGFKGAKYKKLSAKTQAEAEKEYSEGYKPNTKKERKEKKDARNEKKEKFSTNLHKTGELVYFCDGACQKNPGASGAGVSIYKHGRLHKLFYGSYTEEGSNNIGELQSMIFCMRKIKEDESFAAIIYADSQYAINCVTKWANNWSKNNWIKQDNKPVLNKELVEEAYNLYRSLLDVVEIRKVKAHADEEGNELADRMAINASNEKEVNWVEYKNLDIEDILKIEHSKK